MARVTVTQASADSRNRGCTRALLEPARASTLYSHATTRNEWKGERPMTQAYVLHRPVLLFSGVCRFCRWAARIVAWVDRRDELEMLPPDHDEARTLLASIPEDRRAESWWLVLRDGSPVRGDRNGALLLLIALWIARPVGRVPTHRRVSSFHETLAETAAQYRARLST